MRADTPLEPPLVPLTEALAEPLWLMEPERVGAVLPEALVPLTERWPSRFG